MEQNGDRDMQAGAGRPAEEQETVWEQFVVEDIVIETLAIDGICGVY
ncbi:MAG: mycofactocin precursor [Pelotomaculum sp.]|nr:mycofactocin precursor [Pelotomaculum sp.]